MLRRSFLQAAGDRQKQADLAGNRSVHEWQIFHVLASLQHVRNCRELEAKEIVGIDGASLRFDQGIARIRRGT
jgi:hypothetical protein